MIYLFLLFLFILQAVGCFFSFVYYTCTAKRFHLAIMIPIEIISLFVIPFYGILLEMSNDIESTISSEAFYSISILCILFYFVSTYSKHVFSLFTESVFFAFILAGWIFNLIIAIQLILVEHFMDFSIYLFCIGSTPIFCLLTTGLMQSGKRWMEAYRWKKKFGIHFI